MVGRRVPWRQGYVLVALVASAYVAAGGRFGLIDVAANVASRPVAPINSRDDTRDDATNGSTRGARLNPC